MGFVSAPPGWIGPWRRIWRSGLAYPNTHIALTKALLEACQYCAEPRHWPELSRLLSDRRYLGMKQELIWFTELSLDAITKEELQEELLNIWNTQKCTVLMITHDIDEALFLADRLVMMTNGPAASIGEVLTIDFQRPRHREDMMEDPKYYELRNQALDFLYNRFAHDADAT